MKEITIATHIESAKATGSPESPEPLQTEILAVDSAQVEQTDQAVEVYDTIAALRKRLSDERRAGRSIGLVPTMGALHAGHKSLIRQSVSENDVTVVSIFVNPTQFGPNEDLEKYPRNLESDIALCADAGATLIFHPSVREMYPERKKPAVKSGGIVCSDELIDAPAPNCGNSGRAVTQNDVFVDMTGMTEVMCGRARSGHFRGVMTVVSKLFLIVQPERAYFGEKDAQQLAVIRALVRGLNFPVDIVGCPTLREADGLALSSRNAYLSIEERKAAPVLQRALCLGKSIAEAGERDVEKIIENVTSVLCAEDLLQVDYVELHDAVTLGVVTESSARVLLAAAVYFGKTRLIDNLSFSWNTRKGADSVAEIDAMTGSEQERADASTETDIVPDSALERAGGGH